MHDEYDHLRESADESPRKPLTLGDVLAPTAAPRTDDRCWPLPCRDYHETHAHRSGDDPCRCGCHDYDGPGARAIADRREYAARSTKRWDEAMRHSDARRGYWAGVGIR